MRIVKPISINDAILTSSTVPENDFSDWLIGTTYAKGDRVNYIATISTVTITIASPSVISFTDHGFLSGQIVTFTTTGTLPTGFSVGIAYYVVNPLTDSFNLAIEKDGQAILTTGSQSGVHTCSGEYHSVFESLRDSNLGSRPPTSLTNWINTGPTNRWNMFDQSLSSQTQNNDSIVTVFDIAGFANSVALLNMRAKTVQIVVDDVVEGEVYNQSFDLKSTSGITSYYAWFFEPIVQKRDLLVTDLPAFIDSTITVTVTDTGNTVKVGALVLGNNLNVGFTQYGMSMSIEDFSVKSTDQFGRTTFIERDFRKTLSMNVWVDNSLVDETLNVLSDFRATPVVYEGSDSFSSSILFGTSVAEMVIPGPVRGMMNITIEGLT